jgi:hypothetical protein
VDLYWSQSPAHRTDAEHDQAHAQPRVLRGNKPLPHLISAGNNIRTRAVQVGAACGWFQLKRVMMMQKALHLLEAREHRFNWDPDLVTKITKLSEQFQVRHAMHM